MPSHPIAATKSTGSAGGSMAHSRIKQLAMPPCLPSDPSLMFLYLHPPCSGAPNKAEIHDMDGKRLDDNPDTG
eukprot:13301629-Alexandrium_andersonii.AAC.1